MNAADMKVRAKAFAIRVVKLVEALPRGRACDIIGGQLLRAGTSVGSNYRAVCRAKSRADFINKLRIVEEECDESMFWMEILMEAELVKPARLKDLYNEANEILAIIVSSAKTARSSNDASIANRKS